jgi:hypothetical protein
VEKGGTVGDKRVEEEKCKVKKGKEKVKMRLKIQERKESGRREEINSWIEWKTVIGNNKF